MENRLVSGGAPLLTACSLYFPHKKRWSGDVGEGLGKQEIRDIGEVYSFGFFSCRNVFRIKLDMTFSRLPEEKYFLIPEGALGKWNSWATRLAWPGFDGKGRSHVVQCDTLIHHTGSEV